MNPGFGVGLSYRPQFLRSLLDGALPVGHLEVLVEHSTYDGRVSGAVRLLAERIPLVGHGVNQSLGTEHSRTREAAVAATRSLAAAVGIRWIGDHIAATSDAVTNARQLLPLPRTEHAARRVAVNAREMGRRTGLPVVLEYIASSVDPGGDYSDGDFVRRVLDLAGCGLLLDLHNLYANGLNWRRDPAELLDGLPIDRTVQVHLAGGSWRRDVYVDSHSAPVPEPVWDLLDTTLRSTCPLAVTLERDDPTASLLEVRDDLDRAAELLRTRGGGTPIALPKLDVPRAGALLVPDPGPDIAGLPRAPSAAELARKTRTDLRSVFRGSWPTVEPLVEAGLAGLAELAANEITPIGRAERAVAWLASRGGDVDQLRLDIEVTRHQLAGRPGDREVVTVGASKVELETTDRFGVQVRVTGGPRSTTGGRVTGPAAPDK